MSLALTYSTKTAAIMSAQRLAVLVSDSVPSRLIRVPATLVQLQGQLETIVGLNKAQMEVTLVKSAAETQTIGDEGGFQRACEEVGETLVLMVRPKAALPGKKPTSNYVLGFAMRHKLRILNLDDDSVVFWESKSINWTGRVCVMSADKLIFTGGNRTPKAAITYDLATCRETQVEDMTQGRMWHGICSLSGAVFAVGGRESQSGLPTSTAEVLKETTWQSLPDLSCPRESLTLVANSGAVYAFGGFDGNHRLTTIEKYAENHWEILSCELPSPRQMLGVLFLDDHTALVLGGQEGKYEQSDAYEVDLEAGMSMETVPLPKADFFTGKQVVKRGEEVWAFGRQTYVRREGMWEVRSS